MDDIPQKPFHAEFQSFDDPPAASESGPRVAALRAELKRRGYEMGFRHVESGPLVRSSYHAADAVT